MIYDEDMPNYFLIFMIILFIGVTIFFGYTYIQVNNHKIENKTINLTLTDSDKLIIFSKLSSEEQIKVKNYMASLPVVTQKEYVYITVTPTPDGKTYFASEFQDGVRLLGRPFSWYRPDINLQNNNLKVSAIVYDYRIFNSYHYKNFDETNSPNNIYQEVFPAKSGDEFLFIFVNIVVDDVISDKSNNLYMPNASSFALQIDNTVYYPLDFPKQQLIHELDLTPNFQNSVYIQAFGQERKYISTIKKDENLEYGAIISQPHEWITKGKSNAEDGYILFEIPKNTNVKNIKILGQFFNFGSSQWAIQ